MPLGWLPLAAPDALGVSVEPVAPVELSEHPLSVVARAATIAAPTVANRARRNGIGPEW